MLDKPLSFLDMSILTDQQNTTPPSSPASSASSLEKSNSTGEGQLIGSGIIEVSDDNKDPDEVDEDIGQLRRGHMSLRSVFKQKLLTNIRF